jgi:glycosyltransferase involved in cell wall biosynthesis
MSHSIPTAIVCCGFRAAEEHMRYGYLPDLFTVIPNGFNIHHLKPDPYQKDVLKKTLGLTKRKRIIGVIGRYHPVKGHKQVLDALNANTFLDTHFVFIGRDIDTAPPLQKNIKELKQKKCLTILDQSPNIEKLICGLDFLLSASLSEGFPNVVGEAMACGIPCIVTNVGDSAYLVENTGIIIQDASLTELKRGINTALSWHESEYERHSIQARERIVTQFSLEKMTATYYKLYTQTIVKYKNKRNMPCAASLDL